MGDVIRISCPSCGYNREEFVSVGMMGQGSELCPCYHCKRYVLKKVSNPTFDELPTLRCPYCRKSIEPVKKADACAICGTSIEFELIGEWD
jgi:hypothetical protein